MSELIPILISKDDGRGNFVKAEQAQIEKVGQEVANTLTCHEPGFSVHHSNMCIVVMRDRNPDNPSDRTPGIHTEQRLEPNSEGICNTLTTVQKDNLVLEQETIKIKQATKKGYAECKIGGVADFSFPDSKTRRGRVEQNGEVSPTLMAGNNEIVKIEKVGQISSEGSQCGTVVSTNGVYPTISAGCHGYANPHILEKNTDVEKYRIRKLTPLECWRLMGFTDEDFYKAEKVNSNSQLYKQAGNSIVKNVLMAIFNKMVVTA